VLDPVNVVNLFKNGLIIWLKADQEVLQSRINHDPRTFASRPSLTGKGTIEELEEIMNIRDPFYEKDAEIQFDTSSMNVEEVIENILAIIVDWKER
jgi:shikimate kinase